MVDNCTYDNVKLLHELSCLAWFIEHHGLPEAKRTKKADCKKMLEALQKDLNKHIKVLQKMVCSCK